MRAIIYASVVALIAFPTFSLANISMPKNTIPIYSDKIISKRLADMPSPIDIKWSKALKHDLNGYVIRGRKSTENILGKAAIYFPIFEKYMIEYGLPLELKYLSVIESRLRPTVVSHVGAGGLWQLMPGTAKKYGLKINKYVDERFDPQKSTEAAMKHLSYLYQRFGNWKLAIAAYNCGSGRMDRAIRKADSYEYDALKKHLPKETTDYVRRFTAASYALHYYLFHDLHPRYPDYNIQMTESKRVYKRRSFRQIASETGIAAEIIKKLNPSYLQEIIPGSEKGNYLLLPVLG
ncbi:MAG: lytic transglycosylase domain-containing protein, partial [Bacteroidota bacterium]